MAGRSRLGVAGVVAALAILFLSMITAATIILMMQRGALNPSQLSINKLNEKKAKSLTVILYNVSLCGMMKGNYTQSKWKLLIINAGPTAVKVDGVIVEKLGKIVFEKKAVYELAPSEYKVFNIGGGDYSDARVYVHTESGSLFLGGYGVPDPYSLVEVDRGGRCREP